MDFNDKKKISCTRKCFPHITNTETEEKNPKNKNIKKPNP